MLPRQRIWMSALSAGSPPTPPVEPASPPSPGEACTCPAGGPSDLAILNFAFNLECLEAQFYSCAATGQPLSPSITGNGPAPTSELLTACKIWQPLLPSPLAHRVDAG